MCTTRILVTVNDRTVVWMKKNQTIIALSSVQAEYIALLYFRKLVACLRRLFWELRNGTVLADEPNDMYPIRISIAVQYFGGHTSTVIGEPGRFDRDTHLCWFHVGRAEFDFDSHNEEQLCWTNTYDSCMDPEW